ncbi:MAG: type II toxin-antitoxin system HicB family antitoxin, partial [Nitrososphaerales archaeon]
MKTYTARLEREKDGRWTVELEEEPRVHTWGRTVDQALARVREAAALWFQTDENQIELIPDPVLHKTVSRTVEQAREAREQARDADRLAIEQMRRAAAALTSRGISMRDA